MKSSFGKFFKLGNNDSKKCFDKAKGFRINNLDESHFKVNLSHPDHVTVLLRKNVISNVTMTHLLGF